MSNTHLVTGQFVRIEQVPARLSERIGALLVDWIVLLAYGYGMGRVLDYMELHRVFTDSNAVFYLFFFPMLIYQPVCETFFGGQTIGKRMLELRVVTTDGSSAGVGSYLLRWMLLPIDMMFFAAFFSILVTTRRQRLGDLAAGTMVIRLKTYGAMRVSLDEFAYAQADYTPVFPQAGELTTRQADVLAHALADHSTGRSKHLSQLSEAIAKAWGIDPGNHRPEAFVTQVLKDYHYYDLHRI